MEPLSVWAPGRTRVEALVGEERLPFRPVTAADIAAARAGRDGAALASGPGWWILDTPLPAGTRYRISLDDGMGLPDPRTRRQPEGVMGPSEIVDLDAFELSPFPGVDPLGKVFYEMHIGTFTPEGTFDAAAQKFGYLRELGVDIVEVMPICPVPGTRNWGYDGVDIYAVTENYGGPAGFARFVEAAHHAGLAVCLDVVYNHFGPDGNFLAEFGPYTTDRYSSVWGPGVNVDGPDSGPVRRYFIDNMLQWARDYHVDIFRLDAVHAIQDRSNKHILADLSDAAAAFAAQTGRHIALVAESDLNDVRMLRPTRAGGYGMDMQWADDIHHALHVYVTGEHFAYYGDFALPGALEKAMRRVFVHDGNFSSFRKQNWGAPVPDALDSRRFLAYTENHDQVGNRALGDRRSSTLSAEHTIVADALMLLSPFTPLLFMGQEWSACAPFQFFTDHTPELGERVDAGRIAEFSDWDWGEHAGQIPPPQALSTFTRSHLDWAELEEPSHARYLEATRELLRLRREHPDFSSPDREDSEIVRLGEAGYYRRGDSFVVFHIGAASPLPSETLANKPGETQAEETATAAAHPTRVQLPLEAGHLHTLLTWGSVSVAESYVDFSGPGFAVLSPYRLNSPYYLNSPCTPDAA
ncbi:malto-oligosyltrehalose trehalohydrolase [Actinotignum sp. GS-2025c]|uniref:malto-oligosyltrehalose trehalohydrolase n=1 Tax=Actinotignum sp. GS-2025c TaxID=3427276 RepID=UPI003F47B01C